MVMLVAQANWVETLEQLEELIPTYGSFTRSTGRWISKLIWQFVAGSVVIRSARSWL